MTTAAEARAIAVRAIPDATANERWLILAVGALETHWGDWWTGAMRGSNNWGAVIGRGNAGSDQHQDSNAEGSYITAFARYLTPEDSARAMLALIRRRWPAAIEAANEERWGDVSAALYGPRETGPRYYTGTSRDHATNIARHRAAFLKGLETAGYWDLNPDATRPSATPKAPGDAQPSPSSSRAPDLPRLRRGHYGAAVELLQAHVGATCDGRFGPLTETSVREFQVASGLAGDGVAGPATWAAIVRRMTK